MYYYGKIELDESIGALINVTLTRFVNTASGIKLAYNNVLVKGKKCCDEKISETKNFKENARQKEKMTDGFKSNTSMNGKQNQRHRDKH